MNSRLFSKETSKVLQTVYIHTALNEDKGFFNFSVCRPGVVEWLTKQKTADVADYGGSMNPSSVAERRWQYFIHKGAERLYPLTNNSIESLRQFGAGVHECEEVVSNQANSHLTALVNIEIPEGYQDVYTLYSRIFISPTGKLTIYRCNSMTDKLEPPSSELRASDVAYAALVSWCNMKDYRKVLARDYLCTALQMQHDVIRTKCKINYRNAVAVSQLGKIVSANRVVVMNGNTWIGYDYTHFAHHKIERLDDMQRVNVQVGDEGISILETNQLMNYLKKNTSLCKTLLSHNQTYVSFKHGTDVVGSVLFTTLAEKQPTGGLFII